MKFTKMVAAGNDFIVIDNRVLKIATKEKLAALSRKVCQRTFGVGADGLLVVERSRKADVRMRIFNADGSEAEMCGNGSRCFALWYARSLKKTNASLAIETLAGTIHAQVQGEQVKVNLTAPHSLRLDVPVSGLAGISGATRTLKANFINTGVPHAVIFVENVDLVDVNNLGRQVRYHKAFAPAGTNVNFVEMLNKHFIEIRTYERGVEAETLACGTGSVASALIAGYKIAAAAAVRPLGAQQLAVDVQTRSGQVLKIYFTLQKTKFSDVWLEGKAESICEGDYHV